MEIIYLCGVGEGVPYSYGNTATPSAKAPL